MAKRKFKVGDRIFLETFDGVNVFDCVVEKVVPRSYIDDNGKEVKYNMLHTGRYAAVEDYNCLSERDDRVIEYKKKHQDPRQFIKKFNKFMEDNKFDIKSFSIQNYLRDLID